MAIRALSHLGGVALAIAVLLAGPNAGLAQQSSVPSGSATDLDDLANWGIYIDRDGRPSGCSQAQGRVSGVSDPSLTGRALRIDHLGGDCYVGVHAYKNLPARPTARWFRFGGSYQLPQTTLDNRGGPSLLQNVQWAFSKWQGSKRYECALQAQIVRDDTPENAPGNLRLWDGTKWINTGIGAGVSGEAWHQLEFDCEITPSGQVKYTRIQMDDQETFLGDRYIYSARPGDGNEDRLSAAVQLDANFRGQAYSVVVDQVNLAWSD